MSSLVASASLRELFRSLLLDAGKRHRLDLQEGTEFYLVNLLAEYADIAKVQFEEPLALLYQRALEQSRDERIRTLRQLGDVSLYRAGFFSPSLRESAVGADYYIGMGGAAYGQLARMSSASTFSVVYGELESKFRSLVRVLEEIAARGLASTGAQGALRVYETWVRNGSAELEGVLVDVGLLPPKGGLVN